MKLINVQKTIPIFITPEMHAPLTRVGDSQKQSGHPSCWMH